MIFLKLRGHLCLSQCCAETPVCWALSLASLVNGSSQSLWSRQQHLQNGCCRHLHGKFEWQQQPLWLWWMLHLCSLQGQGHSYWQTGFIWWWPFLLIPRFTFCSSNCNDLKDVTAILPCLLCCRLRRSRIKGQWLSILDATLSTLADSLPSHSPDVISSNEDLLLNLYILDREV